MAVMRAVCPSEVARMRVRNSQRQFADSARQLLAKARGEADRLRHEYIGTEHLLLALTAETEGIAATALR